MKNCDDLENILRSSATVAGGFLGTDSRRLDEIISGDSAQLAQTGFTAVQLAARMKEITDKATAALGNRVSIDKTHEASVEEVKGSIACPWPDSQKCAKRITFVTNTKTGKTAKWTDLNIHFIAEHNFFEGKGSAYRIEPKEIVEIIF